MTPHQAVADPVLLARLRRVAARIHARQPMPGRDQDDIAQTIVEVVLRRAARFNPDRGTAEAFVIAVAGSTVRDLLRRSRRAKRDPRRERPLTGAVADTRCYLPEDPTDGDDLRRRVDRALSNLDQPDADAARVLQRFGVNRARTRLGSSRSQWVQTKERIRLTLEAENICNSSVNRAGRAGDGVSK